MSVRRSDHRAVRELNLKATSAVLHRQSTDNRGLLTTRPENHVTLRLRAHGRPTTRRRDRCVERQSLVHDDKSRATALKSTRRGGHSLQHAAAPGVYDFLADIQAIQLTHSRREHAGNQAHRVFGLHEADRGNLNPRGRVRDRDRHSVRVPTAETARAAKLDKRKNCEERVFAGKPHALSLRTVPERRVKPPLSSISYHRNTIRTCSGVNLNGSPARGPSG